MDKDTVAIHFVEAAVARLEPAACARVLAQAGISPQLLRSAGARVTSEAFAALWMAVAHELDDEFFGLDRRRMKVGSFALLCRAVLHAGTLDRAVRQMLGGFEAFLDEVGAVLQLDGDEARITLRNSIREPRARRFADETFLVMVHGLMCWLVGRRIPLRMVAFSQQRPAHAQEYTVMFTPELRFEAPATVASFDARWLSAPVVQDGKSLTDFLRTAPQSVFLKYRNTQGWAARIRRRMRAVRVGDEWPTMADLARELQITPSTLRRHLEREGSSYRAIKDHLRRDAAIIHLSQGGHSVSEVGFLLGFREPSAFHRAFKKWTGVPPGEYGAQGQRELPIGDED